MPNEDDRTVETSFPPVPAHLASKFTPEQWARRQALAQKLKKFSSDDQGRPLRPVAKKIRLVLVLIVCGAAFLIGGISSLAGVMHLSNAPDSADPGWASRVLGPHGGDYFAIVFGGVLLGVGLWILIKNSRAAQ
jgi:hypothetical protein